MNFNGTLKSVELVLQAGQVPLLVGQTGIGKTSLATQLATVHGWELITLDGNLLKEGEIGGLPTIETVSETDEAGKVVQKKITTYALHQKLQAIDMFAKAGKIVLLFIDEINRSEHVVQQELMNLILNREINGYALPSNVRIIAAMNPETGFDYQVVEMDEAQQNRFVWLYMDADYMQWIDWAMEVGIEEKVIEFISTYPEYLNQVNDDDINATPRSYERVSMLYKLYKESLERGQEEISRDIFYNVIQGNVGKVIGQAFVTFVEAEGKSLLRYEDVFAVGGLESAILERIKEESHTRLYVSAKNILRRLEQYLSSASTAEGRNKVSVLMDFLKVYPKDLKIGIMKDIRNTLPYIYKFAIEDEDFIETYFEAFR